MKAGKIILIPFPFAELTRIKVRPAVVISETEDRYRDLIVSAISYAVPKKLTIREILIKSNDINNLRVDSIIKVDRIVTVKKQDKIADLGLLTKDELHKFKSILHDMVD